MNCRRVQNLISAYVDRELSGVEMLVIRQHIGTCEECRREHESLLRVKRTFGNLPSKRPAADLADRICRRLDHLRPPAPEQLLATLRAHLASLPRRLGLAAVSVCIFAALLTLRAGEMSTTNYTQTPVSPMAYAGGPSEESLVRILSANPTAEAVSLDMTLPGRPAAADPFGLSQEPQNPTSLMGSGGLVLTSY